MDTRVGNASDGVSHKTTLGHSGSVQQIKAANAFLYYGYSCGKCLQMVYRTRRHLAILALSNKLKLPMHFCILPKHGGHE